MAHVTEAFEGPTSCTVHSQSGRADVRRYSKLAIPLCMISPSYGLTDSRYYHYMTGAFSSHMGQGGFDDIERSEVVDLELVADEIHGLLRS